MLRREEAPGPVGLPAVGEKSSLWVRFRTIKGDFLYNPFNGALCSDEEHHAHDDGRPVGHDCSGGDGGGGGGRGDCSLQQQQKKKKRTRGDTSHRTSYLRSPEIVPQCGGILADEMGLGKTVVFIALIAVAKAAAAAKVAHSSQMLSLIHI